LNETSFFLDNEHRDVLLYVFIGQNIRDSGILRKDSYLVEKLPIVDSLLKAGLFIENKWYRFYTLSVSVESSRLAHNLLAKRLEKQNEALFSEIDKLPSPIVSFLVNDYISTELYFECDEDWVFDWRKVILDHEKIKELKARFFELLIKHKLCVKTHDYVSTRGGELRDFKYVISPEIRSFLVDNISRIHPLIDVEGIAKIIHLIKDQVEYASTGEVEVTIRQEDLTSLGPLQKMKDILDSLFNRMHHFQMFVKITSVPDVLTTLTVDRDELLRFIMNEVDQSIIEPLLSGEYAIEEFEESPIIDFPRLVNELVRKKYDLYVTAAQFEGKELFKSGPSTEQCIVNLSTPMPREQGLKLFINDLHQLLEESSDQEIMKFREGREYTTLEKWLGLEDVPREVAGIYEDVKEFFHDLNTLRNHYSHLADAKGIYHSGIIFRKLIGKFRPDENNVPQTQGVLLEKSIESLEALNRILDITLKSRDIP